MLTSAVLLAAGESRRMAAFKPLLPWFGTTLLDAQITSLRKSRVHEICVVSGYRHDELAAAMPVAGIKLVRNLSYSEGKVSSIKAGVSACGQQAECIVLLAVDQPRPIELLKLTLQEHERSKRLITVPAFRGKSGHPVVFSAELRDELLSISEESKGIRGLLQSHSSEVHRFEINSPIVNLDLNTQTAYKVALSEYPAWQEQLRADG